MAGKDMLQQIGDQVLIRNKSKKELIAIVAIRAVNLLISLLFCKLSCKAKSEGKTGKKWLFRVLSAIFFIGIFTSDVSINLGGDDDDDFEDDDDDFEDDDMDTLDELDALEEL